MRVGLTLTVRLCLIITALLALLTVASGAYVISKARQDVQEEVSSTLTLTGHFLDAQLDVLRDHWSTSGYVMPLFRLRALSDIRHVRVQFFDSNGRLLDSNEEAGGRQPQAPAWFAALVRMTSTPSDSVIRSVSFRGTLIGRLVMAADPTYEIDEMWGTSRALLVLLGLFFLMVNVLVWGAVSRALRPIEQILRALDTLRGGDLTTRLPAFNLPEMSRIGVGFNHLAETLELSVSKNQRLTRDLLNAQETERRNLAHDLHDEIAQCVSAIHADAVAMRSSGGAAVRESAEAIVQTVAQIKESVRGMLRRLRPTYLEGLGLEGAVRDQVASFIQQNPDVACAFDVQGDLEAVTGEVAATVYRIVQESLTNIAMHANARKALVELTVSGELSPEEVAAEGLCKHVHVAVMDDGSGFFQLSTNRGLGLTGIRERVRALQGKCEILSRPGRGTSIQVSLPLPPASQKCS